MSELLVHSRAPGRDGVIVDVTPDSAGWAHVGFCVLRLPRGAERAWGEHGRELCIVILAGKVRVELDGADAGELGRRESVFDGPPCAVYVPAGARCAVRALGEEVEIALCWAPGACGTRGAAGACAGDGGAADGSGVEAPGGSGVEARGDSGVQAPAACVIDDVPVESRGEGIARRTVHPILMDDRPAQSLLVVEVLTPAGHWSSFPPHKHDRDAPPEETPLEETYYHRLRPARGFALQRVYSDDRSLDETLAVHDGDVVLVPRGYHVVAAMPGYDLYYLNVMAGPRRQWLFQDDPDHAWLRA